MELELYREESRDGATVGRLSINGAFECWTLEDVVREIRGRPVHEWKVPNETAIPHGRYKVVITPSFRFKRPLPELLRVPGFTGIRIHPGNSALDSSGCILVGRERRAATVLGSRQAFGQLFEKLHAALSRDEAVWIDIVNPDLRSVA